MIEISSVVIFLTIWSATGAAVDWAFTKYWFPKQPWPNSSLPWAMLGGPTLLLTALVVSAAFWIL